MSGSTVPTSEATASRRPLLVHQLDLGSQMLPALYVAESIGWTNDELQSVALGLYSYQVEKEWHDANAPVAIYSFVKHDTGSTKNVVIATDPDYEVWSTDPIMANRAIVEALGKKTSATFIVSAEGDFDGAVIMNPVDLSGLMRFYVATKG
jgi:hypothetical protein